MGRHPTPWRALAVLLAASVLAGCLGGGSYANDVNLQGDIPPVPHAVAHCQGLACTLDGSGSSDRDGHVVAYWWTFPDGSNATGVTARYVFNTTGRHVVTLTVRDDAGLTNATFLVVHLMAPRPTQARPPPDYHRHGDGTVGSSLDTTVDVPVALDTVAHLRVVVNLSAAPAPVVPASVNVTLVDPGSHRVRSANLTLLDSSVAWDLSGSEAGRVGTWTLRLAGGNPASATPTNVTYRWAVAVEYPPPASG